MRFKSCGMDHQQMNRCLLMVGRCSKEKSIPSWSGLAGNVGWEIPLDPTDRCL